MVRILKPISMLVLACFVAACDPRSDLDEAPKRDLGPFLLGHNIVVSRNPAIGPGSIPVTEAEWQKSIEGAIEERFGRYKGDRLYHFGLSVDGYFLTSLDAGVPGVPSLKSIVFVTATAWDDALGRKLNEEVHEISVISAVTDAGPFPTKAELLDTLGAQVALEVERWLLENPEWFRPPFE